MPPPLIPLNTSKEERKQYDNHGDDYNRPAIVMRDMIAEPVQPQEQRLGDEPEPAPVDELRQPGIHIFDDVDVLGTDEQRKLVN